MTINASGRSLTIPWGAVVLISVLAFADALFNYFWTGNGIHGTEGALLVVVSTLLMAVAAWLTGAHIVHGWLRTLLVALLVLDFIGTGLAAYLLEAWILLALDIAATVAWFATLAAPRMTSTAS
jgi:hypothetical protein